MVLLVATCVVVSSLFLQRREKLREQEMRMALAE